MITALITKIKSPSVSIVAGMLIKSNIGLTMALSTAKTSATTTPVQKLSTMICGSSRYAASITAQAVKNTFMINLMVLFFNKNTL